MMRALRIAGFIVAATGVAALGVSIPFRLARTQAAAANDDGTVRGNAAVAAYMASFDPARRLLHDEPVIGYLTGGPVNLVTPNAYTEPYMRAQYALAPTIVDPDLRHDRPIVLVNLLPTEAEQLERLLHAPGVELMIRLGPGRALIRLPER